LHSRGRGAAGGAGAGAGVVGGGRGGAGRARARTEVHRTQTRSQRCRGKSGCRDTETHTRRQPRPPVRHPPTHMHAGRQTRNTKVHTALVDTITHKPIARGGGAAGIHRKPTHIHPTPPPSQPHRTPDFPHSIAVLHQNGRADTIEGAAKGGLPQWQRTERFGRPAIPQPTTREHSQARCSASTTT
jgi:hypothetical protein